MSPEYHEYGPKDKRVGVEGDWEVHRMFILAELRRLDDEHEKLGKALETIASELVSLKLVKAIVFGFTGLWLTAIGLAIIAFLLSRQLPGVHP